MAVDNELDAVIKLDFDISSVEKQSEKVAKAIKDKVGSAIDKSVLKPLTDTENKFKTIIKSAGKYYGVIGSFTQKGNVDLKNRLEISPLFNKKNIRSINQGNTYSDYIKNISKISTDESERQQKEAKANLFKSLRGAIPKKDILRYQLKLVESDMSDVEDKLFNFAKKGKNVKVLTEEFKKLSKEASKLQEKIKPSVWQRLATTIKRVGFYRIARNLFRLIENGFKQGINGLAGFSEEANNTMSQFQTAFDKINLSFALTFMPLLESITPIIDEISNAISQFANRISEANAVLKGQSTYTAIDTKALKEYSNAVKGATFSFDKFTSLSGGNDISDLLQNKNVESSKEELSSTISIIDGIKTVFEAILSVTKSLINAIKEIFKSLTKDDLNNILIFLNSVINVIKDIVIWIGKTISNITEWASKNNFLTQSLIIILGLIIAIKMALTGNWIGALIALAVTAVTVAVKTIIDNIDVIKEAFSSLWKSIANGFASVINWISNTFIGAINVIVRFINKTILHPLNKIANLFGKSIQIPEWSSTVNWTPYAKGGMVDRGSLFVAGEAGAELVTTMPSGQTGVTNIAQFKQAMIEAIYECADIFRSDNGDVVLNLDGAEIARSKRFKNEASRLNLI